MLYGQITKINVRQRDTEDVCLLKSFIVYTRNYNKHDRMPTEQILITHV